MNVPDSVFVIQAEAENPPPAGQQPIKYLSYDSNGYPWYRERWGNAHQFKSIEEAVKALQDIRSEQPAVYGSHKGVAFSQHALPPTLRSIAGGRIDSDGLYRFAMTIIEIRGASLLSLEIAKRHELHIEATQHHNQPNTPPVLKIKEVSFPPSSESI